MKFICLLFVLLFISCDEYNLKRPLQKEIITDDGKVKVGDNIYLKRINIRYDSTDYYPDNLYFLVDSTDKLISSGLNVSKIEMYGKITVCESTTIFK